MADYTRLIEFKVKDTDLTRAVNKLSKTLESIDKTLKSVDKKLEHIAKKGFGLVTQEAVKAEKSINKVEKSVNRVGRALDKWSKGANAKGNALLQLEKLLTGSNQGLIKKVALIGGLSVAVAKANQDIKGLVAQVTALNTAWVGTAFAITGGIGALAAGTYVFDRIGRAVFKAGKMARQADYDFRNLIKTVASRGARDFNLVSKRGLEGVLSQFPEGSILGGSARRAAGKAEWGQPFAGDKMGEAVGKAWTAQIKSQVGGLTLLNKQLSQATALQKNINAFSLGHARAVRDVAETQVKYNLELLKTKAVQAVVTADIWAGQKALQAMAATARGVTGFIGGIFGGKFGKTGQAAGVIALSRSIEFLTGKLGFLNKAWIENTKRFSQWVSRGTEAITAINLVYTGLSKALGAANWTVGAIKGFINWEQQAMISIRRVNTARINLDKRMAGLLDKGQNPFTGFGAWLRGETGERGVQAQLADKGESIQQRLVRELEVQQRLLQATNTTATDYLSIKSNILRIEKEITAEQKRRGVSARELLNSGIASSRYGRGLGPAQQERLLRRQKSSAERFKLSRSDAAVGGGFLAFEKQVKKIQADTKKIQVDTAKGLKIQTQAQMRSFAPGVTAYAPGTAGPARPPGSWQNAFSMGRGGGKKGIFGMSGGQRAGSMASSAMIGGGFPLLFGQGGLSALGGGLGGLAGGALGGGFGFALSIVGTAIASKVEEVIKFRKEISDLNKDMRLMGIDAGFSAKQIVKLGKSLGITKKEALAVAKGFKRFGGKEGGLLAEYFGSAQLFEATAGGIDVQSAMAAIKAHSEDMTLEEELRLRILLQTKGVEETINALVERRVQMTKKAFDEQQAKERKRVNQTSGSGNWGGGAAQYLGNQRLDRELDQQLKKDREILDTFNKQRDAMKEIALQAEKTAQSIVVGIESVEKELRKLTNPQYQIVEMAKTIGSSFEESFKGIIKGSMSAQQALANLFQRTADMFLDMAAKIIAEQIKMQIMGIALNMFSGFKGGGGGKKGEVNLDAIAAYTARAAGGPVTGGQTYVVGEKGPELFTPTSSGNITPNHELGGSTNIVVNVDASGSDIEGDQEGGRQLGEMLAAAIQSELIKQQRPGGLLTK